MSSYCKSVAKPLSQVFVIAEDFNQKTTQFRFADALMVESQAKRLERFQDATQTQNEQRLFIFGSFRTCDPIRCTELGLSRSIKLNNVSLDSTHESDRFI